MNHGFLRTPQGAITTLDAPGAGTGPYEGTIPEAINAGQTITGHYYDSQKAVHGFLRIPH
jgi:hypothetical protein